MRPLYQQIAARLAASANCVESTRDGSAPHLVPWIRDHRDAADYLTRQHMPSGSGFDNGTILNADARADVLRFSVMFHHMDEFGGYSGWTVHTVTVRASLVHGLEIRVSGRDRNGIKDYIADTFDSALRADVDDDYIPAHMLSAAAAQWAPGQAAQS